MMLDITEDLLRKLAFQRGVLTMIRAQEADRAAIEKAIRDLDRMIEDFTELIP